MTLSRKIVLWSLLLTVAFCLVFAFTSFNWWVWTSLSPVYLTFIPELYTNIPLLDFFGLLLLAGVICPASIFSAVDAEKDDTVKNVIFTVRVSVMIACWFIWNSLASVYLTFLPSVFMEIPFWHFFGLILIKKYIHSMLLLIIKHSSKVNKNEDSALKKFKDKMLETKKAEVKS